jgi:hypothetical protein
MMNKLGIALALCALALLVVPAAAHPSPFVGSWVGTDSDGSTVRISIGGGPSGLLRIHLFDDGASVGCPATGGPAFVNGQGTVSGSVLTFDAEGKCPSEGIQISIQGATLTHHPNDTLTDDANNVFHRHGS